MTKNKMNSCDESSGILKNPTFQSLDVFPIVNPTVMLFPPWKNRENLPWVLIFLHSCPLLTLSGDKGMDAHLLLLLPVRTVFLLTLKNLSLPLLSFKLVSNFYQFQYRLLLYFIVCILGFFCILFLLAPLLITCRIPKAMKLVQCFLCTIYVLCICMCVSL